MNISALVRVVVPLTALVLGPTACSSEGRTRASAPLAGYTASAEPAAAQSVTGVKWDWNRLDRYGPHLERFAGSETFYELVWCDVEPGEGRRDWARSDDAVESANRYGFRMHLKIRIGSCWATEKRLEERGERRKTASLPPEDVEAYRQFVRAIVTRYAPQGVHHYAVENEVNLDGFWQSTPSEYENLVRLTAPVIREVDHQAVVLDAGLSSTAYGAGIARWLLRQGRDVAALVAYRRYYERRFAKGESHMPEVQKVSELEEALEHGQAEQNLRFLDATLRLAQEGTIDAYQLHFYERWDNVPLLLAFLRQHLPAGLPVEAWETGIFYPPDRDEVELASEAVKVTALLLAGAVRPVIWLPAAADTAGRGDEVRWGLFDPQARPRLAAEAFLDLTRMAAGSKVLSLSSDSHDGIALTRDGETHMILWSDDRAPLAGQPPLGTAARRVDGQAISMEADIETGPVPVVLEIPGPVETALELVQ